MMGRTLLICKSGVAVKNLQLTIHDVTPRFYTSAFYHNSCILWKIVILCQLNVCGIGVLNTNNSSNECKRTTTTQQQPHNVNKRESL